MTISQSSKSQTQLSYQEPLGRVAALMEAAHRLSFRSNRIKISLHLSQACLLLVFLLLLFEVSSWLKPPMV